MLVHEDLPPSKFYLNPKFSAKPWNRLNPLDYAANSKITETKKAPLFEKCFFCDRDRIQTCNRLIRSQLLYSVELRGQSSFSFKLHLEMVTATGFKPVTGWSVVSYSIQLSYAANLHFRLNFILKWWPRQDSNL